MHRPLVITEDRDLLDDLVRIAAAAGAQLDVAHVPAHARPFWSLAPLVVVGADLADAVAAFAPPARDRVLLVTRDPGHPDTWRRCVTAGAQAVVSLPEEERRLVDEFADAMEPDPRSGAVLCVIGGRGGAGASVLSACLALRAAGDRRRTLLVDADPSAAASTRCSARRRPRARDGRTWWPGRPHQFRRPPGRAAVLGDLTVLSFHRGATQAIPAQAMRSVLEAGRRGFDLVVVDLPRHLDPSAIEALTRASRTLLVATADVRGVLAAAQVLERPAGTRPTSARSSAPASSTTTWRPPPSASPRPGTWPTSPA